MPFSNLETSLVTGVVAIIVGYIVRVRSVTKTECKEQHREQDLKFRILFNMVRALVVHSKIPEEEKVKILNNKGDD